MASPDLPLHKLAEREGRCRKQMTQLLKLSWLSPKIIDGIMRGSHPPNLTRKQLLAIELSPSWSEQERLLEFR